MSTAAWSAEASTKVKVARKAVLCSNTGSRFNATIEACPSHCAASNTGLHYKVYGTTATSRTRPFTWGAQTPWLSQCSDREGGLKGALKKTSCTKEF